jgi:hypothetical protein
MDLVRNDVKKTLKSYIEKLYRNDGYLIEHDVSERAIAHKLAEYLQSSFKDYNVDCEYNRNIERGPRHTKSISVVRQIYRKEIKNINSSRIDEDTYAEKVTEVTAYPDIIIHRRGSNEKNLLIIEIKKSNSGRNDDYDHEKLRAFTSRDSPDGYAYIHGVFMKIPINGVRSQPELKWFSNGQEES